MTLFHEWQNVVVYPQDGSRVRSQKDRLDTTKALDPYDAQFSPGCAEGALITPAYLLRSPYDDVFEAMEVGDYGEVTIWTRNFAFQLWSREPGGERFKVVRRHPPISYAPGRD